MQTEVIVVGAGPAGLMLANELTLAGIPAVVLEKQRTRSTQSRAGALQPRTAEVLDLRGLLDPLLDRALPRGEFGGHFAGLPVELDCVQYPGLGPRMIDLDLTTQDGPTRVSRLMHSGRGLLLSLDDTPRSIDRWADRVDYVAAKTAEDIDAVLIRPDGYIAWSGTDEQPLETALARWFG
jgi:2-polyprenyl-6-methoxyphenol hydroxylase-like FAD-dependent oxidoreductase